MDLNEVFPKLSKVRKDIRMIIASFYAWQNDIELIL